MTSFWCQKFVYAEQVLQLSPEVNLQLTGCPQSESLTDSKKPSLCKLNKVSERVNNELSILKPQRVYNGKGHTFILSLVLGY